MQGFFFLCSDFIWGSLSLDLGFPDLSSLLLTRILGPCLPSAGVPRGHHGSLHLRGYCTSELGSSDVSSMRSICQHCLLHPQSEQGCSSNMHFTDYQWKQLLHMLTDGGHFLCWNACSIFWMGLDPSLVLSLACNCFSVFCGMVVIQYFCHRAAVKFSVLGHVKCLVWELTCCKYLNLWILSITFRYFYLFILYMAFCHLILPFAVTF